MNILYYWYDLNYYNKTLKRDCFFFPILICSQRCSKIAKILCWHPLRMIIIDNSDVLNLTTRENVAIDQTDPLIRLQILK